TDGSRQLAPRGPAQKSRVRGEIRKPDRTSTVFAASRGFPSSSLRRTKFVLRRIRRRTRSNRPQTRERAGDGIMPASNIGRLVWHELHTSDRAKAQKFYAALLPWENKDVDMGPGEKYGLVLMNGKDFAGITKNMAPAGVPSHWLSYLGVDDVDAYTK